MEFIGHVFASLCLSPFIDRIDRLARRLVFHSAAPTNDNNSSSGTKRFFYHAFIVAVATSQSIEAFAFSKHLISDTHLTMLLRHFLRCRCHFNLLFPKDPCTIRLRCSRSSRERRTDADHFIALFLDRGEKSTTTTFFLT